MPPDPDEKSSELLSEEIVEECHTTIVIQD